jgi:hypothetical protein
MKTLAIKFGWFLLSSTGVAFKASAATAAVVYTARYLKVLWL